MKYFKDLSSKRNNLRNSVINNSNDVHYENFVCKTKFYFAGTCDIRIHAHVVSRLYQPKL